MSRRYRHRAPQVVNRPPVATPDKPEPAEAPEVEISAILASPTPPAAKRQLLDVIAEIAPSLTDEVSSGASERSRRLARAYNACKSEATGILAIRRLFPEWHVGTTAAPAQPEPVQADAAKSPESADRLAAVMDAIKVVERFIFEGGAARTKEYDMLCDSYALAQEEIKRLRGVVSTQLNAIVELTRQLEKWDGRSDDEYECVAITDGSVRGNSKTGIVGSYGCVIEYRGSRELLKGVLGPKCNPMDAEFEAARVAAIYATTSKARSLVIYTDCQSLVHAFADELRSPSMVQSRAAFLNAASKLPGGFRVIKVSRSETRRAHDLAASVFVRDRCTMCGGDSFFEGHETYSAVCAGCKERKREVNG